MRLYTNMRVINLCQYNFIALSDSVFTTPKLSTGFSTASTPQFAEGKRWGKEQRRLHAKQFDDAFHLLADNPEIGIVRILHKRMDARTQLIIS